MASISKVPVLCVALLAMIMLGSCATNNAKSDNWLVGRWAFDLERTKANLPADIKAQGVPDAQSQQIAEQLTNQLIDQMENVQFDITADEFTTISRSAPEKTATYEVLERPDENTIVVKSDRMDETSTFIKSGKYICIPSIGAVQFKMYFKPVN